MLMAKKILTNGINLPDTSDYFTGRTAYGWPTPRFGVGKEAS
jgi:hypothetical protein